MYRTRFIPALLAALLVMMTACTTTTPGRNDPETRRQSINAGVDNALEELYRQINGSQQMVASAKGVLVFPAVLSAGFVFGGSHGEGALRVNGRTTGFYRQTGGSWGLQIGAQSQAVYILFMTQEALDTFHSSSGWSAGGNANVTVITAGANAQATTSTVQRPIIAYVLSNAGLMAGITLEGTVISRLEL